MFALGSVGMLAADQADDSHFSFFEFFGHFDGHDIAAARRNNKGGVLVGKIEVPQDPFCEPGDVLEEHCLALAVRADHEVMKTEGEFDDRIESGERSVTGPHLLNEDAAVSRAEQMDHAAGENGFAKPFGGLLNLELLERHDVEQFPTALKVLCRRRDHVVSLVWRGTKEKVIFGARKVHPTNKRASPIMERLNGVIYILSY